MELINDNYERKISENGDWHLQHFEEFRYKSEELFVKLLIKCIPL